VGVVYAAAATTTPPSIPPLSGEGPNFLTMLRDPGTLAIVAVFGLVFGSFVTALSYRLPRGESIAAGRSRCPACGTTLGVADLVPVLSWVFSRGRCRHCASPVSWRYPAIELVTMVLFLTAAIFARSWPVFALLLIVAPLLVALTVTDLEFGRLPHALVLTLLMAMIAWRWIALPGLPSFAIGLGSGAAVLLLFLALNWIAEGRHGVTAIAPGDAKLVAVAAVAFPFWQFVLFVALMALLATMFGLATKARTGSWSLPLGPAFALALWICLLVPGLSDILALS